MRIRIENRKSEKVPRDERVRSSRPFAKRPGAVAALAAIALAGAQSEAQAEEARLRRIMVEPTLGVRGQLGVVLGHADFHLTRDLPVWGNNSDRHPMNYPSNTHVGVDALIGFNLGRVDLGFLTQLHAHYGKVRSAFGPSVAVRFHEEDDDYATMGGHTTLSESSGEIELYNLVARLDGGTSSWSIGLQTEMRRDDGARWWLTGPRVGFRPHALIELSLGVDIGSQENPFRTAEAIRTVFGVEFNFGDKDHHH